MRISNTCKKMKLPNGKVVDILSTVFEEMEKWLQDTSGKKEAGGYIVGYQHYETENITLEQISHPYRLDIRKSTFFSMRDPRHKIFLMNCMRKKSFYMGVWHTHHQMFPEPSPIDWRDWYETLEVDRTGCEYVFFIIAGFRDIRIWVGDFKEKNIIEIFECPHKNGTGMGQEYGVHIIKMFSKIQGQVSIIGDKAVSEAIMPYYPLESDIIIDLTQVEDVTSAQKQIERAVDLHIKSNSNEESYSVFIMAKIPYACYLGYALGNKVKSVSHQFFRDTQDWKWRDGEFGHFYVSKPKVEKTEDEVNLLVEISGNIDRRLVPNNIMYSIKAENPGFMFIQSKEQLLEFQIKFRELLNEIRDIHGEEVKINLVIAAPNPISFEIGKCIMKNIDPTIILYDKVDNEVSYQNVMCLHSRIRRE